jgi:hypothetical protein
VSETRADWIEVLADTPAPDKRHVFSPAVGNLVCERIANGESLLQISREPAMPSRSTMHRWCRDNPEFREEYQIAVQLRADGLLEETIDIIDDKKEIVTETVLADTPAPDSRHIFSPAVGNLVCERIAASTLLARADEVIE